MTIDGSRRVASRRRHFHIVAALFLGQCGRACGTMPACGSGPSPWRLRDPVVAEGEGADTDERLNMLQLSGLGVFAAVKCFDVHRLKARLL